jgi:hypothetical protein
LKAITMAESADRQARRESLERELQNVRSIIGALREAVGTTPEQNEAVFQLERAEEREVQLLEALAELDADPD